MPDQRRAEKTTAKTRRGRLPAPTEYMRLVASGDGRPCDGCGETIAPTDTRCTVRIFHGLDWQFHKVCYDAWATVKR